MIKELVSKNILVTGGAGFIGSNLCEFLLKNGANVFCLDNFSTGYHHNISQLLKNSNFVLIEGDIRELKVCQESCKGIDFVLHQAALGSVPRSLKDPILTNDVNINGFLNMLIAARDNSVKRFVYAASSSTYGDSPNLPKFENEIGAPLSPYAITKYVNELYADIFYKAYGLESIGLRYFNVFGRRQDPKGAYAAVIPKFINQLINLESPTINGDGSFSRDFTYIDNVIQMNMLAILTTNKSAINQVFNTAFGESNSLNQLVKLLKKYLHKYNPQIADVKIIYGPEREGDIPHSLASVTKAVKLLNYNPKYNFENGLNKTIDYFITKK